MKNPLTLKLNELKKLYLLNNSPSGEVETNKENLKSSLKTVLYENNNKTKGSIVLHRLHKLLNLTSTLRAEARGNLKTNRPYGDFNQSGQIKLLNKGENSTLELLKINEIKKESLLNKTGYIQLFSYNENIKNKKNTLIYQYLKNTLQRISPIANTQKRNGILFNYSKTITYRLFSILYFNSFRKKYLLKKSQIASLRKNYLKTRNKGVAISSNKIPFIKRKVRKAISRLRGKSDLERSLLFHLRKFNLAKVFRNKFQLIIEIMTRKFKKAVVFQLIRLHHPYHDTNILANLKSVNLIPAFLSGLNLKIGGRLMREPIIPRLTTKNFERGAISPGKVNYLDIATVTKKNRKGAYSITIKSAQNFYK